MTKLERVKELQEKEKALSKLGHEFMMAKGNFETELQELIKDFGGQGDKVDILTLIEKTLQHKESLIIS